MGMNRKKRKERQRIETQKHEEYNPYHNMNIISNPRGSQVKHSLTYSLQKSRQV
jgi:hypothetical protein